MWLAGAYCLTKMFGVFIFTGDFSVRHTVPHFLFNTASPCFYGKKDLVALIKLLEIFSVLPSDRSADGLLKQASFYSSCKICPALERADFFIYTLRVLLVGAHCLA